MRKKTIPLIVLVLSVLAVSGCATEFDPDCKERACEYSAINVDGVRCIAYVGHSYEAAAIDCDWDGSERGDQ